jgi:hypothetical protein
MIINDVGVVLITLGLGILIGINIRHEKNELKYKKTFLQVDQQVRKELDVALSLVESLKQDKNILKEKIWYLEKNKKDSNVSSQ